MTRQIGKLTRLRLHNERRCGWPRSGRITDSEGRCYEFARCDLDPNDHHRRPPFCRGEYVTFEPAEDRHGPAARYIRLLEEETDQRLLRDAFRLPDPGPACAAAPTLGKQIGSDAMLDLVLPVFARLTPMQQAGMAYCLPDEVLADQRARSLRNAAVLHRRIQVWNSRSSNGAHFLPEIVDCLRAANGLTATQANNSGADSGSTGAADLLLADAEQPKFAQTLRLSNVEQQLPGLLQADGGKDTAPIPWTARPLRHFRKHARPGLTAG